MNKIKVLLALVFTLFVAENNFASCPVGQTDVQIIIQPDNLGAETTWELVNVANQAVLGSGGPYINGNTTLINTTVCVDNNSYVTFIIHDSFGDGMCCLQGNGYYKIQIGSNIIAQNGTFGFIDSVNFFSPPVSFDAAVLSLSLPAYIDTSAHLISGKILNAGTFLMNSLVINYQIDNDPIVSRSISSLNIAAFAKGAYAFGSNQKWHPTALGNHQVKIWASSINGNNDQNTANDIYTTNIYVAEHLPRRPVFMEGFTSSSDTVGELQEQLMDTIMMNTSYHPVALKYHLGFPAPFNDPMYLLNQVQNDARKTYYNVNTVPKLVVNGNAYNGLPSNLQQSVLDETYSLPGLFDIFLDETKTGNDITIKVRTVSLVPFGANDLKLFVVLCENPVHFSTSPAPGTKSDFNFVMRQLLTGTAGVSIHASTAGLQDSVTLNYTVNPSVFDTSKLRTIIFIQNVSNKEVVQDMYSLFSTGSNHQNTLILSESAPRKAELFVRLYPNPAKDEVNFSFFPEKSERTKLRLINVLGETVIQNNITLVKDEEFSQKIEIGDLQRGLYLLVLETSGGILCRKIILN